MMSVTMTPTASGRPATVLHVGDVDLVLDTLCQACDGKGRAYEQAAPLPAKPSVMKSCEVCQGKGRILAPAGHMLLGFLRKHLGEKL